MGRLRIVTMRPGPATRTGDRPCVDCLDPSFAGAKPPWQLSRPTAFWLIAYAFAIIMLGTTLPTPLYVIYQAQWHFPTSLITLIFAVYAVGVLAALLGAGRSSDQVGRRPVLAAAIGLSIISAVTFILAPSVGWLFVGRVLSGFSAGLMTGTATAALTETARPGSGRRASLVSTTANMGGLGLGPLLAGLLAQYAPQPTVLPFLIQLGLVAIAGLGLLIVPETVSQRSALSLRFRGLGIPQAGRPEDVRAMAAHVVGMAEAQASFRQFVHDFRAAGKRSGGKMIDEMTATQVRERAAMTPDAIISRLAAVAPSAVRARRRTPALMRWAVRIKNDPPFDAERWRYGYLVDTIFTRDTWMHRLDIGRATGRLMELTAGHDGRLVADVVGEWAGRHAKPFTLTLTGDAGGKWRAGDGGELLELDALDFCWTLAGRAHGTGLLATEVPF